MGGEAPTAIADPSEFEERLVELSFARRHAQELLRCFSPTPTAKVLQVQESAGGGRKLVVELASGQRVETVLIRHDHRTSGRSRHTVCVSSQVGCARACSFCATGSLGLLGQLSAAEILERECHRHSPFLLSSSSFFFFFFFFFFTRSHVHTSNSSLPRGIPGARGAERRARDDDYDDP